jgi:NAD(P)-dependent dehydrogenase (short-subunit alcohol dehydrogenase family)
MTGTKRVAMVTGANRGIGLEVARELAEKGMTVLLGARDLQKGRAAAEGMRRSGIAVEACELDVTAQGSVERAVAEARKRFGRLDVLVNNAAIFTDKGMDGVAADLGVVREELETNLFGAWRLSQACVALMREKRYGRIVNVSSDLARSTRWAVGIQATGCRRRR